MEDEKKEYKETICDLEDQIAKLGGRTFKDWSANDVLDWILAIDNGVFKPYESMLTTEILNDNIGGKDLATLNVTKIKELGVNKFAHQMLLLNKISDLVETNKMHKNDQDIHAHVASDNEGGAVTFV